MTVTKLYKNWNK